LHGPVNLEMIGPPGAMDERAFIELVERAETAQFSRLIARPSIEEEEILVSYLGEDRYSRMHERSLRRNLRRADEQTLGNVVVLHGIMGAELSIADPGQARTSIWPNALRQLGGGLVRLELDAEGVAPAHAGDDCDATGILKRYYGELLLTLAERWRTRAFFYDWRKPVATAAQDLAARLAHWFPPGERVNFVAHAMGGLVMRAFIAQNPERWKAMGGRLIMLGTPNHGTYGVARMLTGLDPVVRRLALRERIPVPTMARIIATFPSVYELLPSPFVDPPAATLYKASTWPVAISQKHLDAALERHKAMRGVIDFERMVYVAGQNVPTFVSVDPKHLDEPGAYGVSRAGDGRVAHEMGRLARGRREVTTFYADASHGDLTSHRSVLDALDDLLQTGTTDRLATTFTEVHRSDEEPGAVRAEHDRLADQELESLLNRIATRENVDTGPRRGSDGAAPEATGPPPRVSSQERELEDNMLRDFLGGTEAAAVATGPVERPKAPTPTIKLVLGEHDIATAHEATNPSDPPVDVIAVGHYTGVKPQAAELALDRALSTALLTGRTGDGVLTELTQRGTISGGLGQPFFLDDPRDQSEGRRRIVCIAGLGIPGRFGPGDLTVVVRELVWAAGRLGRRHVASVLIGAGNGNLTELTAVTCWLRGIGEALAGHVAGAPRVDQITFVEMDPERLLNIDDALKEVIARMGADGVVDVAYEPLSEDARKTLDRRARRAPRTRPRRSDEVIPTRITLSRVGRQFRFGAITATAAVPERDVDVDPKLVEEANDLLAGEVDGDRRRDRGRFLHNLLFPRDLRDQLSGDAPVVMILDSTTARIHWELVARMPGPEPGAGAGNPDGAFLGVSSGFTRQLRTGFAPPPEPPPPPERLIRVLVVADPAEDAHLPGAEEEGIEVANLFERMNAPDRPAAVEVVRLFGPRRATRAEVMRHLSTQRFHVLHFAGHCTYDRDDPPASGWIFTGGARLTAAELRRIDRVPEFIFSNACESGITPDRAGNRSAELAPSFAEAFFERGVGNFVCTAWPVNDRAARLFATRLYGTLLGLDGSSMPMYRAMASAREGLADTADGHMSWGAYQHYGDPLYRLVAAP
jgi:pimeloyl-ACP methyl ester carboxylesterase